ncbi:MAG: hypothetical protein AAF221_15095 [Pseudomonadota bacterium]
MKYIAVVIAMVASAGLAIAALPNQRRDGVLTALTIMEKTIEAAGGASWTDAKTLTLSGYGTFWPKGTEDGSYVADDYRMWRVFSGARTVAHGPDGWVRIDSKAEAKTKFQIAFDGTTTWTHKGIVPAKQAEKTWANNFGFGIIREALEDGFTLTRRPDDLVDGNACYFVDITSPDGAKTLFAMDKRDFAIRYVGFNTPRGYHERRYSDFVMLNNPKWRQARRVRLFYDGVKANEIYWETTIVDAPIDKSWFAPPTQEIVR